MNLADMEAKHDWHHEARNHDTNDGPDIAAEIAYEASRRYDASTGQWFS